MNVQSRYQAWLNSPAIDPQTKQKLRALSATEREAVFCSDLTFGTGGMRGQLGLGTNRLNPYTVARATRGLGDYLLQSGGRQVAIGYDTRHGSLVFAGVAAGVLAKMGILVWLYDQPLPTPMVSFAVRELGCDAGVVITASHNPAQYNGYKVYGADGCQITDAAADAITACIERVGYDALSWLAEEAAMQQGLLAIIPQRIYRMYIEQTLACRISAQGDGCPLRVVYTPLHGAGHKPVTDVLKHLRGVRVIEVKQQCLPDGDFPTCPKPNPELAQALALGLACAKREKADLLIATDPDCDRVGVAVREVGSQYRVLTGNEVGLLLMAYILSQKAMRPEHAPVVVKTVVTSDLAFAIAAHHGAQVREVLTGFKYIGEMIGRMEALGEAERFAFGFEESCGYLAGTHVRDKDGVMGCLLIAEMAQFYASGGLSLAQALQALYARYGYMGTRLLSYDIPGSLPMAVMAETMRRLRAQPPTQLGDKPIARTVDYLAGIKGMPASDVLCYCAHEGLKAIVRPSGTEPKVKVYLSAMGANEAEAQRLLDRMSSQAESWIVQNRTHD